MTHSNKPAPGPGAVSVYTVLYIAYTAMYAARLNFSVAGTALAEQGLLTVAGIGTIGALFSIAFALGKLLLGPVADKYQPRLVLTLGCAVSAAANILLALAPTYTAFLILWTLNGLAQSVVWGPLLRSVSAAAGAKSGRVMSVIGTCVALGSLLGLFSASKTIALLSVQWAFAIPGLLLAAASLPAIFLPRISPPADSKSGELRAMLGDKKLLAMMIPAAAHGAIKETLNLFAPAFFVYAYSLDVKRLGWFIYAVPGVALIFRLLLIPAYRLFKQNELTVAAFFMTLSAVVSAPLLIGGLPSWAAAVCLGVCSGCIAATNGTVASFFPLRYAPKGQVSTATGILDFATYAGGAAAMYIFGLVITSFGYAPVFAAFAALSLLCVAVFVLIDVKERKYGRA